MHLVFCHLPVPHPLYPADSSSILQVSASKPFLKKLINFWLRWVFVAAHGLSLVVAGGVHSPAAVDGLLIVLASLVAHHGLQGTQALVVVAHRRSLVVASGF